MTITYITNYLNHHTRPLGEALYKLLGNGFAFIETQDPHRDANSYRQGYAYAFAHEENHVPEWVHCAFLSKNEERCRDLATKSDVVIIANAADSWILPRLKAGKLTFRAHERWHRRGLPWHKWPRAIVGGWLHHGRFSGLYLLSASAYTTWDAHRIGCFRLKAFRWGYFPEFRNYTSDQWMEMKHNEIPRILWASRMVDWKHAEELLQACAELKVEGCSFQAYLVGNGPMKTSWEEMRDRLSLQDCVVFLGEKRPGEVRDIMEKSDVFLLTSDFQEGWGVVLNEAMNSGCAVIASHAAGATPYLLRNEYNGLIYESGNIENLKNCLRRLLNNSELCQEYGKKAFETIRSEWQPDEAARRLILLCDVLLGRSAEPLPIQGPGSRAPVIQNNWFAER